MKSKTICIIMGGGRGTRLYPLTMDRCKPAVPLAGKYRLVDIPISNCLHSGLNQVFVLTQFNTASLHRHIQDSYKFDPFGGGCVDILAAEQTDRGGHEWYQGTADAVRQNLHHYEVEDSDLFLILSGDQLYRMDFDEIIEQHRRLGSELTIAAKAMPASEVSALGVMEVNDGLDIVRFEEKPTDPKVIKSLHLSDKLKSNLSDTSAGDYCLASMGIYVFNKETMYKALEDNPEADDFGKEIIPGLLGNVKISSYVFEGYWEDIGTIASFFEANLALTEKVPPYDFYEPGRLVYTHARYMPPSKIDGATFDRTVISGGSMIEPGAEFHRCMLGVRSRVGKDSRLENVVMMGQDWFETAEGLEKAKSQGKPPIGIGKNCVIKNAIVDKNARIGDNVRLSPEGKEDMWEQDGVLVRDGVLVVMKGACVPSGTIIDG